MKKRIARGIQVEEKSSARVECDRVADLGRKLQGICLSELALAGCWGESQEYVAGVLKTLLLCCISSLFSYPISASSL